MKVATLIVGLLYAKNYYIIFINTQKNFVR